MSPFSALLGSLTNPLDFLADFNRQEALDAGVAPTVVNAWAKIHAVYIQPTSWSRHQARAIAAARKGRFTADQLNLIEQKIKHIKKPSEKWALRHQLLGVRGNYEGLRRKANELVPDEKKSAPKTTLKFGRSRDNKRTLMAVGDEKRMAALEFALRRRVNPHLPAGPQMMEALFDLLFGEAPGGLSPAIPRPLILIPLPEYVRILDGSGDETILGLTDGTTMTGAEYLAEHHGKDLEVSLFHPQEGAVNLYRTERFANQKQRDLARATQPVCPVPGCRYAADNCEVHHITAWSHGGQTNIANLATLCRYHNRTNDDDPGHKHRGRIHTIRGAPTWVSPRGYPVVNKYHQFGALYQLYG